MGFAPGRNYTSTSATFRFTSCFSCSRKLTHTHRAALDLKENIQTSSLSQLKNWVFSFLTVQKVTFHTLEHICRCSRISSTLKRRSSQISDQDRDNATFASSGNLLLDRAHNGTFHVSCRSTIIHFIKFFTFRVRHVEPARAAQIVTQRRLHYGDEMPTETRFAMPVDCTTNSMGYVLTYSF